MKQVAVVFGVVYWLFGAGELFAAEYYVSKDGNDGNSGSLEAPFATIGRAVKGLTPGDTLFIREGVYRESVKLECSGTADQPITIQSVGLEDVEISGVERLNVFWKLHDAEKGIYVAELNPKALSKKIIENNFQVFVDKQSLLPARWPNCRYDEVLSRKGWHPGGRNAEYGHFNVPALKGSELELEGVDIYLNIIHQFFTWKRKVSAFDPATGRIEYPRDIVIAPHFFEKGTYWERSGWKDDYFYLQGDYGLLDFPGEFHYDAVEGLLYLIPPDGEDPNTALVEIKTRLYGLQGSKLAHVKIDGINFFGCAVDLNGQDLMLSSCSMRYPLSDQQLGEMKGKKIEKVRNSVTGRSNLIEDLYVAYASTTGFKFSGQGNRLENAIIHDSCYSGSLIDKCVAAGGASVMRRCTIFNSGNVGVHFIGPGFLFELNHIYNNGLISHDVSSVYTSSDKTMKSRITHNWVHDNPSPTGSIGIRGDDLTRGLTVDHNVVWNVSDGIVVKGDQNVVFNNTVFHTKRFDIRLPKRAEPRKQFQVDAGETFLDAQNENSFYYNNLVNDETSDKKEMPSPPIVVGHKGPGYIYASEPPLVDVEALDFRPLYSSREQLTGKPLPDGTVIPVVLDQSSQPYIGAYGFDGDYWKPGAIHGMKYQLVEQDGAPMLRFKYTLPLLADDTLEVSCNGDTLGAQSVSAARSFRSFSVPVSLKEGSNTVTFSSELFGERSITLSAAEQGTVGMKRFAEPAYKQ